MANQSSTVAGTRIVDCTGDPSIDSWLREQMNQFNFDSMAYTQQQQQQHLQQNLGHERYSFAAAAAAAAIASISSTVTTVATSAPVATSASTTTSSRETSNYLLDRNSDYFSQQPYYLDQTGITAVTPTTTTTTGYQAYTVGSAEYFRQQPQQSHQFNGTSAYGKAKLTNTTGYCARSRPTDINNNNNGATTGNAELSGEVYARRESSESAEKETEDEASGRQDEEEVDGTERVVEDEEEEEEEDEEGGADAEGEEEMEDECQVRTIYLSANCILKTYLTSDVVTAINEHFQRSFALYFNSFRNTIGDSKAQTYESYYKDGQYKGESSDPPAPSTGNSVTPADLTSEASPGDKTAASNQSSSSAASAAGAKVRCCSRNSSSSSSTCSVGSHQPEVKSDSKCSGQLIAATSAEPNSDQSYYRFKQNQRRLEVRKRRNLRRTQLLQTPMIKRKLPASFWKFNTRFSCYYYASIYGSNGNGTNSSYPYASYKSTAQSYSRSQYQYDSQSTAAAATTSLDSYVPYQEYSEKNAAKTEDSGSSCAQYNKSVSLSVSMSIGASTTVSSTSAAISSSSSSSSPSLPTATSSTSAAAAAAAAALATLNNDLTLDMSIHISPSIGTLATPSVSGAYHLNRPLASSQQAEHNMASTSGSGHGSLPPPPPYHHSTNHPSYLGLLQSSFNHDPYYAYNHHPAKFSNTNTTAANTTASNAEYSYSSIYSHGSQLPVSGSANSSNTSGTGTSGNGNPDSWRAHYPTHYATPFSQMVAQMQQHNVTRTVPYYSSICADNGQYSSSTSKVEFSETAETNGGATYECETRYPYQLVSPN